MLEHYNNIFENMLKSKSDGYNTLTCLHNELSILLTLTVVPGYLLAIPVEFYYYSIT